MKTTKTFSLASLLFVVSCFLFLASSSAAVPNLLSYSGLLKDDSGNFLTGTYSMTFRIYNAATGGTSLWSETQSSVSVSSGRFSVELGSVSTLDLDFDETYWLSVEIASDGEMTPRQKMTSAGYSIKSEEALTAFTQTDHDALSHMNVEGVKSNISSIAKTNFKIDAHTTASANSMGDMIIDTFSDSSGIDSGSSSGYTYNGSPDYNVTLTPTQTIVHPDDFSTGLQGYWKLEESSGSRVDETANSNDLSVSGTVSTATGANSDATHYGNSNDFPATASTGLDISDASATGLEPTGSGGSFSIAFWVATDNYSNGDRPIVSKGNTSNGYVVRFNTSGNMVIHLEGNTYTTTSSFSTSTWYHVGVVFDEPNNTLTVYRNGSQLQQWTSVTAQLSDTSYSFYVARHPNWNGADSQIDDLAFWNNVQSSSTFDDLYNGQDQMSGSATVISVAFSEPSAPTEAMVIPDETLNSGSITYYVSRDNGTTWTQCTKETVTDISGQPSGTQLRWKAVIGDDAQLDAIAVAV